MRKFLDKYKNHIKDNEIFKNVEKACKTYELSKIQEKNFSTCFLNPVEYEIFISFLKEQNVRYVVFDENGKNERKSVLFLYEKNYDLSDFYSVFKCIGDFKQVSHRDVLGSLTALGIERNDIENIFIYPPHITPFTHVCSRQLIFGRSVYFLLTEELCLVSRLFVYDAAAGNVRTCGDNSLYHRFVKVGIEQVVDTH